jgi:hypothetical protein
MTAMDWKSFIASLAASISWPLTVLVVFYILRKQVAGLAERLKEISIPGGGKATFEQKIEEGRQRTDEIVIKSQLDFPALSTKVSEPIEKEVLEMAEAIPEYVVIAAYADVERVMVQLAKKLDQAAAPQRLGPHFFGYLEGQKLIPAEATDLLMDLYEARNIATHAKGANRISPGQAVEYLRQSRILQDILQRALITAGTPRKG